MDSDSLAGQEREEMQETTQVLKTPDELNEHMFGTYRTMRIALLIIGAALPLLLPLGAKLVYRVPMQDSMSAYYHAYDTNTVPSMPRLDKGQTIPDHGAVGQGVMRNWFVGSLFAIGTLLIAYKGFSRPENTVYNIAGVLGMCVALIPMKWGGVQPRVVLFLERVFGTYLSPEILHRVHYGCAIAFFVLVLFASVMWGRATLSLLKDPQKEKRWTGVYLGIGSFILLPVVVWLLRRWIPHPVFWMEALGVWAFAAFWLAKTIELGRTKADQKAAEGRLEVVGPKGDKFYNPPRVVEVASAGP